MIRILVRLRYESQIYCVCVKELVYQDGFLWWHEEYAGLVDALQIPMDKDLALKLIREALKFGYVDLSSYPAADCPDAIEI